MRVPKRKYSEQLSESQRKNKRRLKMVNYQCSSDSEDEMELEDVDEDI